MIVVPVPKDINEYEKKPFFGLTIRQIISLTIGVILSILIYLISLFLKINQDISSWLIMIIVIPSFMVGFIKKDGLYFDDYFKILYKYMTHKNILIYESNTDRKESINVKNFKKKRKRQKIQEYQKRK